MKQLIPALLILASTAVCIGQTPPVDAHQADLTKAVARYTEILEHNPKDAESHYNRGTVFAALGQLPEAIADYSKAVELKANYFEAYCERARAYVRAGKYDSAISDCNRAIEMTPQAAEPCYVRGLANAFLGNTTDAREDLRKAVAMKPALIKYVASVYARFKWPLTPSLAQAVLEDDIQQAVANLDYPDKVSQDFAKMVAGWNLVALKERLVQARFSFQQQKSSKEQLAKSERDAITDLSGKISKEFAYDEHVFDLADVIKQQKASCIAYSQLLIVLGTPIGLSVEALDVKEARNGALPPGIAHMASVVGLSDGTVVMVDLMLRFVSRPFVFQEQFARSGRYLQLIDRTNRLALHPVIRVFERDALVACLYNNRGFTANGLGRYAEAITDCTKAIALEPGIAETHTVRGRAYSGVGQYDKAISDFTKAIEIDPKHATAYVNRGVAYASLGKTEEARKDLRTAVKMQPLLERTVKAICEQLKLSL